MPPLLLGYLKSISSDISDQLNVELTRFGGKPAIPKALRDQTPAIQTCNGCGGPSLLVAQIWTTYDNKHYRVLYLLCCSTAALRNASTPAPTPVPTPAQPEVEGHSKRADLSQCRLDSSESWRAVRLLIDVPTVTTAHVATHAPQEATPDPSIAAHAPQSIGGDDWLSAFLGASVPPPQATADPPKQTEVPTCPPPEDLCLLEGSKSLDCVPISFEDFHDDNKKDELTARAERLAAEYEQRCADGTEAECDQLDFNSIQSDGKATKGWDVEEYEGNSQAEKFLFKFQQEVSKRPTQVFRYSFGGDPLWMNAESSSVPPCRHCGGARTFECQLMPNLLSCLNKLPSKSISQFVSNSNWGVVAVFSCENDCCKGVMFDEHVVVTAEI